MIKTGLRFVLLISLLLPAQQLLALDIQAQGLLKGAAIVTIDGKQRMLKVGQRSPEGVLLVEANAKQGVIEVNGQRRTLTLSRRIDSKFNPVTKTRVAISRNNYNQYISTAKINGKRLQVLVDTGANAVAMSSRQAQSLGIDFRQGTPGMVRTASGNAPSFNVKLRSVEVGGIQVSGVQAFVIEGGYPEMVLLGMSFLQHVDLSEKNGILYLEARY